MAENVLNFSQDSFMNNKDSQSHKNCDENNKSKKLLDEQLGASWFSPPITSTQKVSFDFLDEDDSQGEWVSVNEAQTILEDLTADEIDPAYLLGLSPSQDQTNISETPPPQGVSQNWNNRDVTDYLFNGSKVMMTENSNISTPIIKAPSKRLASHNKRKSAKIKRPKIEGYSCKLNGAMYQVNSRDLDVLEAIDRGLKLIQEKIHQNLRMCNVRSLCLQLTQIETVLDILDNDDQLELGMHVEAWDEMMILTKALFHDTQHEVQLCKNKRLEHDTSTDELTSSFSQSLNICDSKCQTSKQSSNQQLPTLKRGKQIEVNHSSIIALVEIEQEDNEIQIIGAPQKFNKAITEKSANKSLPSQSTKISTRGNPSNSFSPSKGLKKNTYAPATYKKKRQISNQQNVDLMVTSTDNFQGLSGVVLNEPFVDDSTSNKDLSRSRKTLAISSTDLNMPVSENYLESLSNTFSSVLCANESLLPSQETLQVNDSQMNAVRVRINSSQQVEDEIVIVETNTKATDYQDGSFIASLNSSIFRRKGRGSSKIVMMNFKLGPFVLKGVLSPGKNNMKMTINNRIYIASLANDGTIEMNGFSFPSIGNWIKSVEGKRFDKLSRLVQKTLEIQYNGKPLEEVLEMREESILMENEEIPLGNPDNIPQETFSFNSIKNLLNDSPTEYEPAQKNGVPDDLSDMNFYGLQLVPDGMTRHIKTILLHTADEYFPICQCLEQYWSGKQPFPQYMLDEVDDW